MKQLFHFFIALPFLAAPLNAQVPVDRVHALALNGAPVTIPVYMAPPNSIGDLARGGPGGILVDPRIGQTSFEFRQFVLAHESGHVVGLTAETAADYYAGQILRVAGFTPQQMNFVASEMARLLSATGDATHPPASVRVQIVLAGYQGLPNPVS